MKMDKEKELPKRKPTRLKNFDYSSAGAYFVTICIHDRMNILSEIVKENLTATDKTNGLTVGEGLAPPEITVKLKPCGYRYSGRGGACSSRNHGQIKTLRRGCKRAITVN